MKLDARRIVKRFRPVGGRMPRSKIFRFPGSPFTLQRTGNPAPPGTSFGRSKTLEVRLARNAIEVRYAQQLRYQIFYEEMSAVPDAAARITKRDADQFDAICDHLLVLDHGVAESPKLRRWRRKPRVVGTYRLLRQDVANRYGGFYSQGEFDIAPMIARQPKGTRFLELGRSCVLKAYRNKPTLELMWKAIMSYVRLHKMDVMIGCASLEGTDIEALAMPLSFLYHTARAPEEWRAIALPERYVDMNILPPDQIDARAALKSLPPLVKGYLRAGCYIGDGAVVDHQFNTTDVLITMPVAHMAERYLNRFSSFEQKVLAEAG